MKDLNKFKILLFACLLFICAVSLGQSGPTPLIQVDADQIIDGAVSAIKTDGSLMLTDGSNAATTVAFPGDLTGVNASFTGVVEAGGVELMKYDGSNAETSVSLGFPQKEVVNLTAGNTVVTFSEVTIGNPDYFFVYVNGLFQSLLSGVSSNTVTLDSTLSEDSVIVGVKFD